MQGRERGPAEQAREALDPDGHSIDLLRKAFREAEKLAPAEQDRLASFILADLESERAWDERFLRSQDLLARLADEALEDDDAGRTVPLSVDEL